MKGVRTKTARLQTQGSPRTPRPRKAKWTMDRWKDEGFGGREKKKPILKTHIHTDSVQPRPRTNGVTRIVLLSWIPPLSPKHVPERTRYAAAGPAGLTAYIVLQLQPDIGRVKRVQGLG